MATELEKKVIGIIASELNVEESEIKEDSAFVEDLGADSLDTVKLVMAIEDEFGIEIKDEDSTKIKTVADAINCVKALVKD